MVAQHDEDLYDATSFFRMPTYEVRISLKITSSTLLTMPSLLDTDIGPRLINMDLLPSVWKDSIKPNKSPPLQMANRQATNVEGSVPLFVRIGYLSVCTQFGIVENVAAEY